MTSTNPVSKPKLICMPLIWIFSLPAIRHHPEFGHHSAAWSTTRLHWKLRHQSVANPPSNPTERRQSIRAINTQRIFCRFSIFQFLYLGNQSGKQWALKKMNTIICSKVGIREFHVPSGICPATNSKQVRTCRSSHFKVSLTSSPYLISAKLAEIESRLFIYLSHTCSVWSVG